MASTGRMSGPERRTQILEEARRLFVDGGYRTTTADVAAAAGVSDALVVKHFGTKEGLFRAAIVEPLLEVVERTLVEGRERVLAAPLGDPVQHRALLVEYGRAWTKLVSERRAELLAVVRESAEFPHDAARLAVLARELIDDLAKVLERVAVTSDYGDFDPRVGTYAALGALTLGALLTSDADAFTDAYYDMTLFGVLSEEGRRAFDR